MPAIPPQCPPWCARRHTVDAPHRSRALDRRGGDMRMIGSLYAYDGNPPTAIVEAYAPNLFGMTDPAYVVISDRAEAAALVDVLVSLMTAGAAGDPRQVAALLR